MTNPGRQSESLVAIQGAVKRIIESMAVLGVRVAWRLSLQFPDSRRPRRNG